VDVTEVHEVWDFLSRGYKTLPGLFYEKLQISKNTLHSWINVLKLYYEQVLKREYFSGIFPTKDTRGRGVSVAFQLTSSTESIR